MYPGSRLLRAVLTHFAPEDDIVTERVLREVERFKHIILDYIEMQIEYSKKVEDEWQKVIPQLAMIHVENGGSPLSSMNPISEAITNGAFHEQETPTTSLGLMIQEDYIPSDGHLADSLSDLTLMANDDVDEDPFQRSPYGSRPMEDSNPDVSL